MSNSLCRVVRLCQHPGQSGDELKRLKWNCDKSARCEEVEQPVRIYSHPDIMCFFERTDYSCGDWKWGNMIQRCQYQHRIGETCGQKLLHEECRYDRPNPCKHCQAIDVKKRRLIKLDENIQRWAAENDKFAALLAKAKRERTELIEKIKELNSERPSVQAREMGTMNGLGESRVSLPSFEDQDSAQTLGARPAQSYAYAGRTSGAYRPGVDRGEPVIKQESRSDRPTVAYSAYSRHR